MRDDPDTTPRPPRSILVINQQWSNHGDEAAHKGLLRTLRRRFPEARISVLVFAKKVSPLDLALFRPDDVDDLEYPQMRKPPPGRRLRWASRLPAGAARLVLLLSSARYRRIARKMRDVDLIVSAPSGVDLGPYRHWRYLALLMLALASGRPTAVYAISFGPLPRDDAADLRFSALSVDVLRRLDFLSLREPTSQRDADERGIAYVPATDTAFLDASRRPLPEPFLGRLGPSFVVFVPNELSRWHVRFQDRAELLDDLYGLLLRTALEAAPQVVLMPQLFGRQDDTRYFEALRDRLAPDQRERVLILPTELPTEVQKELVSRAEMVVGARYHSVVFALHLGAPFLALSYEHKIHALVAQAGLSHCLVRLDELDRQGVPAVAKRFAELHASRDALRREVAERAVAVRAVAEDAADAFARRFGGVAPGGKGD